MVTSDDDDECEKLHGAADVTPVALSIMMSRPMTVNRPCDTNRLQVRLLSTGAESALMCSITKVKIKTPGHVQLRVDRRYNFSHNKCERVSEFIWIPTNRLTSVGV